MMQQRFLFYLLGLLCTIQSLAQKPQKNISPSGGFLENKGQIRGLNNEVLPNVYFKAEMGNVEMYLTSRGLLYMFNETKNQETEEEERNAKVKPKEEEHRDSHWQRMDMVLEGAKISKENIVFTEPITANGVRNYYFASENPVMGVQSFNKVYIKNIYPGIDWVLYTHQNSFKYDFIIHPGANINLLQIKYEGAAKLKLSNNEQNLVLKSPYGSIEEGKLYCYSKESGRTIAATYKINTTSKEENKTTYQLSFNHLKYDHSQTLVIDPPLQVRWATYYGAVSSADGIRDCTTDRFGNFYTAGYSIYHSWLPFTSLQLTDPGNGAYYNGTYNGGPNDAVLMKFSATNKLLWSTYYGGTEGEAFYSITMDKNDNVLVCGSTTSPLLTLANTSGGYSQQLSAGNPNSDALILKFNPLGALSWGTCYGGPGNELAYKIVTDKNDDMFIIGKTDSSAFQTFDPGGGVYFDNTFGGKTDLIILKFSNSGNRLWATLYGGDNYDVELFTPNSFQNTFSHNCGLTTDNAGNVFICATTQSTNLPTVASGGAFLKSTITQTNSAITAMDMFLLKFTSGLQLEWATYYGGNCDDGGGEIAIDLTGNLVVTGVSSVIQGSFPLQTLAGAYNQTKITNDFIDVVLLRFSNTGVLQWSTLFGGGDADGISGLSFDPSGNFYISGSTSSSQKFPVKNPGGYYYQSSISPTTGTLTDIYVAQFNANYSLNWCTYYQGPNNYDMGVSNTYDPVTKSLYVVGEFNGGAPGSQTYTVDPGNGAYYKGSWGGSDENGIIQFAPTCPKLDITATITAPGCSTPNSGSINVSSGNGTGPYSFLWSNGSTLQNLSNLSAQNYSLTVIDSNGCPADSVFNLNTGATLSLSTNNIKDVSCFGKQDGEATITATGGTSGFTYSWSGITNSTSSATGLSIGIYTITVKDASNCSSTITVSITEPPALQLSINATASSCAGSFGQATANVTGGTSGYTYSWSNAATNSSITFLGVNTYTLTVTDTKGCSKVDSVTTTQNNPNLIIPLSSSSQTCSAFIALDAGNPGATYSWSTNETTQIISALSSGTYSVLVTDGNGCTGTASTQVLISTSPIINLTDINTCALLTTLDAGNAGATYLWNTSATTQSINVTASGTYSVTVTNAQNCSSSKTIQVQLGSNVIIPINDTTSCTGQVVLDIGNTNWGYMWYNGTTTSSITVTSSGSYSVTVTDQNGCSGTKAVQVNIGTTPVINLSNTNTCASQITLNAGNTGATYSWSTNATTQTITALSSGTYSVVVTNTNGCSASKSVSIQLNSNPVVNLKDTSTCGNLITLSAGNSGATYLWSNGATTQTILASSAGLYSVTITDAASCTASGQANVVFHPSPIITLPSSILTCAYDTILNAGNTGSTYSWSNGSTTQLITANKSDTYTVTITTANGCTATASCIVVLFNKPVVNPQSVNVCDSSTVLDAGNNYTSYVWSNGATTQFTTVQSTGIYTVTVTNVNNCSASATASVILNNPPTLSVPLTYTSCNQPITIIATGTNINSYLWSTGATTQQLTATASGIYTVTVTSVNGCTKTATTSIQIYSVPIINLNDISSCNFSETLNAGNTGSSYLWSNGSTTQSISINTNGTYSVIVTNLQGCSASKSLTVTFNPPPSIIASNDTTIEIGSSVVLNASGGTTYQWLPGTGLNCNNCPNPTATPAITITYTVLVTDNKGCSSTETITIEVIDIPCGELYLPTAFSPNSDGMNDVWKLRGNKCITSLEVMVYNRWGQKVFESTDKNFIWDGTFNSKPLDTGVFVYTLTITYTNQKKVLSGNISLIR